MSKTKPSVIMRKSKKGTSIEFRNINMKPEELHAMVEGAKKGGKKIEGTQR